MTDTANLEERVAALEKKLEETLLLLSDAYRYGQLQKHLAAGDFKAADDETVSILLEVSGTDRESLSPDLFKKFPCNTLQVVDRLWTHYSEGRFGFSVQLRLYQEVGGNEDTLKALDMGCLTRLGDRTGWRKDGQWQGENYDEMDFSLAAPEGCFPSQWLRSPYGAKMVNFCFTRFLACDL